ncbi:hypothetical protein SDC9_167971 [bioreactor metagenome]|uniref:Uncharacterized protein n=1 Tax=bioreactor metagenome TaxID=1076179 RepID=A0A645G3R8_9ZZZZ
MLRRGGFRRRGVLVLAQSQTGEQLPCQVHRHDVNKFALQHIVDFKHKAHNHAFAVLHGEVVFFKLVKVLKLKGLRRGNVYGNAQKIGQRR